MKIIVCMGSSCFSRDNKTNLQLIQDFLSQHELEQKVELEGTLCSGKCSKGPVICINDVWYHEVTEPVLYDLLKQNLMR